MSGSGDSYSGIAFDLGKLITEDKSAISDFEAFLDKMGEYYLDGDNSVNFNNEGGEFSMDIRLGSFFVATDWTDYEYEEYGDDEGYDEGYDEEEEEEEGENESGGTPSAVKVGGESVEFEGEEEDEDEEDDSDI
jgi:hypothetical protein